jgi:hypothetical protein
MAAFNRWRTVSASTARTATWNSGDLNNNEHRGIMVVVRVTTGSATPSVVPSIQGKDPVSGAYFQLHADIAAITATTATTFVYVLYPGVEETEGTGGVTQMESGVLPKTFRILFTHGDADSITYSVSACLLV